MKLSVITSLSLVLSIALAGQAFAADTKTDTKSDTKIESKSESKSEAKVVSKEKQDKERVEMLKELAHKHKFHDKTESTGDLEIKLQKHLNKLIKEKYEEIKALEHDLKQIDSKAVAPKGAPTPTHLRDNVNHVKEQIERKHGEKYTR